jgi:hypothetical protein
MSPQQRFCARKAKVAGELRAGSLGDLQAVRKPPKSKNGWFRFQLGTRHEHMWLRGEVNRVCSLCGLTEPLGG